MKTSPVTSRPKILVTDSLFILDQHIQQLNAAGYEVERLDKPDATEAELVAAISDKVGYIMGGVEDVTPGVLAAAPKLKAIVFAGTDWQRHIPANDMASEQSIKIANSPGGVSEATAEYALTLMLAMLRRLPDITPPGKETFVTTQSLCDQHVGIIGMGHVPQHLVRMLSGFNVSSITYANRSRHHEMEKQYGLRHASIEEVLATSDIVSFHLPSAVGEGYLNAQRLGLMREGAVLIDTAFDGALDSEAAYAEVSSGRLRIATDGIRSSDPKFKGVAAHNWLASNSHTGYNTEHSRQITSDLATDSMISLLSTGEDQYRVQ